MRRVKKIKQHDKSDCAVACISAIAEYYGLKLPLIRIREACGATQQGTTIKGIVDCCKRFSLDATPYRVSPKSPSVLKQFDTPVILHTITQDRNLHFVIFCGYIKEKIEIMDPSLGDYVIYTEESLLQGWSGYIVVIEPGNDFRNGDLTRPLFSRISDLAKTYSLNLFHATISAMVYVAIGISFSLFLQRTIDNIIPSGNTNQLFHITIILTSLILIAAIFGYIRIKELINSSIGVDSHLTKEYLSHLFKMPIGFFGSHSSGELNARIGDIVNIRNFITEAFSSILISMVILIISFGLMFTLYWKLALYALLFIPIYLLIYYICDRVNRRINQEIIESSAKFEESVIEGICAVSTIKYSCLEEKIASHLVNRYDHLIKCIKKGANYNGLFNIASESVSKSLSVMVICAGSLCIFRDSFTIGELASFYTMVAYFATPLSSLIGFSRTVTDMRISAERLFEILDYPQENESGLELSNEERNLTLEIENLTFSYPGKGRLFDNLTISMPPGSITAITGSSGCGKSTLASIIMRGFDVQGGSIKLGGVDISKYNLKDWRRYIGYVPQDSTLLNRSIIDNISCMEDEPDINRIAVLMSELGMDDYLSSMPLGLMTKIGERGALLSGGQRQKIAIARALYARPAILLMDEATSSLDKESEKLVLRKVDELRKERNMIVIMITHKPSNYIIADKIVDIKSGHSGGGSPHLK